MDLGEYELAGFCLQQAVEKFLKAFLLSKGWSLRRIHDLDALIDDAADFESSLESFRTTCQRITDYYVVERYPFSSNTGLTAEDVRDSFEQVRGLVDKIREGLN